VTATEPVRANPPTATRSAVSKPAVLALALGGLLMAAGGNLHPRAERATVRDTLADMLGSPAWNLAHLLILAGLVISVGAFVIARRAHAFAPSVDRWLTVAIVGWGLASIELVPHLLAVRDLEALHHHEATPILDTHLMLAVGATPALGLSAVALAVATARAARTVPAWILAGIAAVGGTAYAAAGPLIQFLAIPELSVLFAGQSFIAVWLIGTAVRLAVRPTTPTRNRTDKAMAA
jgi:hypothetical protein